MTIDLIDIQYFPPVIYFSALSRGTNTGFPLYERFQKMGFANRCVIAGPNGRTLLTIPIRGGRDQRVPLGDIEVDNSDAWQRRHWRTIESCYSRSPWFEEYREELNEMYQTPVSMLAKWNFQTTKWICDKLSIGTSLTMLNDPPQSGDLHDNRSRVRRQSVSADPPNDERYPQVFEDRFGFISGLSILDRLFCMGPALPAEP